MIEVLTLFLGLFNGVQTVQLSVEEPVDRVEIWLDGKAVGKVSKPPWRFQIDLGSELRPHELILIARDAELHELERQRQWINLDLYPPVDDPPAEAREELTAVAIRLEDKARLPPMSQMQTWFTKAGEPLEVVRVDEGAADVVIVRDPEIQPFLDRLATFFFQLNLSGKQDWDAIPLADKEAFVTASHRELRHKNQIESARRSPTVWERWNGQFHLGDDVSIRFVEPQAAPLSRIARRKQIFKVMSDVESQRDSLLWHAVRIRSLEFELRTSDAVAMAGLEAGAGHRRRAVLLLMGDEQMGRSRYTPSAVEAYFRGIQVPLFVWAFRAEDEQDSEASRLQSIDSEAPHLATAGWSGPRIITYPEKLSLERVEGYLRQVEIATGQIRQHLRRQRIVWLRGAHLPDRIELADAAVGITLAGDNPAKTVSSPILAETLAGGSR